MASFTHCTKCGALAFSVSSVAILSALRFFVVFEHGDTAHRLVEDAPEGLKADHFDRTAAGGGCLLFGGLLLRGLFRSLLLCGLLFLGRSRLLGCFGGVSFFSQSTTTDDFTGHGQDPLGGLRGRPTGRAASGQFNKPLGRCPANSEQKITDPTVIGHPRWGFRVLAVQTSGSSTASSAASIGSAPGGGVPPPARI